MMEKNILGQKGGEEVGRRNDERLMPAEQMEGRKDS